MNHLFSVFIHHTSLPAAAADRIGKIQIFMCEAFRSILDFELVESGKIMQFNRLK